LILTKQGKDKYK